MTVKTHVRPNSTTISKSNWEDKKKKLQEKFPELTEPDLEYEEGKVETLLDRIHAKIGRTIGKTKVGLHRFIKQL